MAHIIRAALTNWRTESPNIKTAKDAIGLAKGYLLNLYGVRNSRQEMKHVLLSCRSKNGADRRKRRSSLEISTFCISLPVVPNCPARFETPQNDVDSSPSRDLTTLGYFSPNLLVYLNSPRNPSIFRGIVCYCICWHQLPRSFSRHRNYLNLLLALHQAVWYRIAP